MGCPKSPDGAQSVIEQLYPKINAVTSKSLVNKLKTYASKHSTTAWPPGMLEVDSTDKGAPRYYYPTSSHCYIRNLLELDALVGGPKPAKEYLHTKDRKHHYGKVLTQRIEDLRWRSHQYANFAENAEACIENLLSDKDIQTENLFDFTNAQVSIPTRPATDLQQDKSFITLRSLEKIEIIERDTRLTEEKRTPQLAVLYLESGNIEKALEFSNRALALDVTCGYAWMVKGYLAVQGVQQAFQDAFLHQELGTTSIAITAEEMYHQERLEAASTKAEENIHKTTLFFLNAWRYWPESSSICISNSYDYEHKIIVNLFKFAKKDRQLDNKLLMTVLEHKRESLDYFAQIPEHASALLSTVIPVVQTLDVRTAEEIARIWMEQVENSVPYNVSPNPPVAYENRLLMSAGNALPQMGLLFELFLFEVADEFCKKLRKRFTEALRVYHLNSASTCYLEALKQCLSVEDPIYHNALKICTGALQGLQFREKAFDTRLEKQWRYMQLKMVVMCILKGFKLILDGPPHDCKSVTTFLLEYATPKVLEHLSGDDYFDRMEDYDDLSSDSWMISFDLTRDECHILHSPLQGFLQKQSYQEMIKPSLPRDVGQKSPLGHIISNLLASESLVEDERKKLQLLINTLEELQTSAESETLLTSDDFRYLEDFEELMASWREDK